MNPDTVTWANFLTLLNFSVLLLSQSYMSSHTAAQVSTQHCSLANESVHRSTNTGDLPHMPVTAPLSDSLSRNLTIVRKHTEVRLSPPTFVFHAPNNVTYIYQHHLESI